MEPGAEHQSLTHELEVKGQHRGRTVLTVCSMATVNLKVQQMILDALAQLGEGERVVIPREVLGAQWELAVTRTGERRVDLTHRNPADDGTSRFKFYTADTTGNPYGAMTFDQEPSLGIPCREAGIDMDGKLVGVVVLDEGSKVSLRGSWSKFVWSPKPEERMPYNISLDGEVFINNLSLGFIHGITLPDKNRMRGWVPVVRLGRPTGPVRQFEMEDVAVAAILAS